MANGTFSKDDPTALTDTYTYSADYQVKDLFQFNKTGTIGIAPLFFNFAPIAGFLKELNEDDEPFDIACNSGKSVEEFNYVFPKELTIISIPDDMQVSNKTLSYMASYKLEDNVLTVKRTFDDKTQGNTCSPEVNKENNELVKKAWKNYKEQVIYKFST